MSATTAVAPVWFLTGSYPPNVGGNEPYIRLLARELARRGWPITVLTQRHKQAWSAVENVDGTTVRRVALGGAPGLGTHLMVLPALFTLLLHHRKIGVLYVCGLRALGLIGMLFALLTRRPVILRSEASGEWLGDFSSIRPRNAKVRRQRFIRGLLAARNLFYRRADRFLSISQLIHDEFLAGGVPVDRIINIPDGINTAAFPPSDAATRVRLRAELGLPQSAFLFVYSGKLNRGKGLDMLVRAWARVRAVHKDAHLVLIGAGGQQFLSCENTLRGEAENRGLAASITFTGYVTRVVDYLRACDAFVFPSESETLSQALIEGMACGLPALASAAGGNLDIIQDGINGRLLPAGDEAAWAEAMLELMTNPRQRQVWAKAGQQTVRDCFSIESVASAHEHLFRTLIAS